jgi:UDP-N-acetylmuramate--alanine ligase
MLLFSFFSQVKSAKHLFWCFDDANLKEMDLQGFSYGLSKHADLHLFNIKVTSHGMHFDATFQGRRFQKAFRV